MLLQFGPGDESVMEVNELLERFGIGAHFAMGKCTFRLEWLKNPLYSEWLADNMAFISAYCIAC